ncbi:hypothetical protein [Azospirillum doebereinerae]
MTDGAASGPMGHGRRAFPRVGQRKSGEPVNPSLAAFFVQG